LTRVGIADVATYAGLCRATRQLNFKRNNICRETVALEINYKIVLGKKSQLEIEP
jgi:hypothetical protein